jgi:LacI family transcriptional regulator, galactose operon repressor
MRMGDRTMDRPGSSRPTVNVLVAVPRWGGFCRNLHRGVLAFARRRRDWDLLSSRGKEIQPQEVTQLGLVDGVILDGYASAKVVAGVQRLGVPMVTAWGVLPARDGRPCPVVRDDVSLGIRMGFDHLLAAGFRHLAFWAPPGNAGAADRARAGVRIAAEIGLPCHVFQPALRAWRVLSRQTQWVQGWVRSLPKPVGVVTSGPDHASLVAHACREAGVGIPEQVGIITSGGDELECEFCNPSLSCVDLDEERIGFEAARILDDLLAGRETDRDLRIEPKGVSARRSTDLLATEDGPLARSLRFVEERACDGIKVQDIVNAMCVSRAWLQSEFQRRLGRSPHEEIMRVRVEEARYLLEETNLTNIEVALHCGFGHRSRLYAAFKRAYGISPAQHRRRHSLP